MFRSHVPLWNGFLPAAGNSAAFWNNTANSPGASWTTRVPNDGTANGISVNPIVTATPSVESGGVTPYVYPPLAEYDYTGNTTLGPSAASELLTASRVWGGIPCAGNVFLQLDPYNDILPGSALPGAHSSTTGNLDEYLTPYLDWPMKRQYYVVHDRMVEL